VQDALAAARPTIEARSHELTVTIAPGDFRMHADATRLEQIVSNLLANAARYTESHGHITVQLCHETLQGKAFGTLRVCDTGRGIPTAMLLKVFDPFTQVSPSIDRSTGGLGLGLTLVRRLAEMHGGSVEALSEGLGLGSTFIVRLPLIGEPPARAEQQAKRESELPPSSARRILLVDDSEDSREMLRELLETMGHEVFAVEDGLQGVARAEQLHPDIALIDIGLPGIDGYEVARRIRGQDGRSPFLAALTGYGSPEAKAKATDAGFDLHLTKPVDLKKLLDLVQRANR
jgi:CheY-like chemotaxis protein